MKLSNMHTKLFFILTTLTLLTICTNSYGAYSITFVPETDRLLVKYQFDDKIDTLYFVTQPQQFRANHWVELSHSGEFFIENGVQGYSSFKPTKTLSFEINISNEFISSQYTPFITFTDNTYWFFTGHYLLSSYKGATSTTLTSEINNHVLMFESADYSNKKSSKVLTLQKGIFQFYAFSKSIESEESNNIFIDPNLPKWISELLINYSPIVIKFYKKLFQTKEEINYELIAGYSDIDEYPKSDGGVIGEQVILNFLGKKWHLYPERNKANVLKLLFHEYAHLFVKKGSGDVSAWITEGIAEYLANIALFELEVIDTNEYNSIFAEYFQNCYGSLSREKLQNFELAGMRKQAYDCGSTIIFLISNAKNVELKELLSIFQKVSNSAQGHKLANEQLLQKLKESGLTTSTLLLLDSLIFEDTIHRHTYLIEILDSVDIEYKLVIDDEYKESIMILALQRLMNGSCGKFSFWTEEEYFQTESIAACKEFRSEMKITGFGGFSMFNQTIKAFEYLYLKCYSQQSVSLDLFEIDTKAEVICKEKMPVRPISIDFRHQRERLF